MIYQVGISGGKDSAALLLWMVHESGYPKEKIVATFCDTQWEEKETYAHVQWLSDNVHPITTIKAEKGFADLMKHKGRFPSAKARFCTEELKMKPQRAFIKAFQDSGIEVVTHVGVRRGESVERSRLEARGFDSFMKCEVYRPLLDWSLKDVFAIHEKYNVPLNPLYAEGALRVGCGLCVMSRKSDVRRVSKKRAHCIDRIRQLENENAENGKVGTFFHRNTVPLRFRKKEIVTKDGREMFVASIDDVVEWSNTGFRARSSLEDQLELDLEDTGFMCQSGHCE